MGGGEDEGVGKAGRGFKREAEMDWPNKSGNGEMVREKERGGRRGGGREKGPVVVDTSATGAAEMEGDA